MNFKKLTTLWFLFACSYSNADVIGGFSIEANRDKAMANKSSTVNVTYYKTLAYDKKKHYQLKGENYQPSGTSKAGIGNTNVVAGDGSTVVVITEIDGDNIAIGK